MFNLTRHSSIKMKIKEFGKVVGRKVIDKTGNRYGKWVVLKRAENSPRGTRWLCKCDCGTKRVVGGGSLRDGKSRSCGCSWRKSAKEMAGQKFGFLTVVERVDSNKWGSATWLCECSCGNKVVAVGSRLRLGSTKSCGCLLFLPEGEASFNKVLSSMKRSAKHRGYDWLLTKEQFRTLTKQTCYYCGAEPNQCGSHSSHGNYLYNGLDRIDNNQGYLITNVVPCCGSCNAAKGTKTTEEFRVWVKRISKYFTTQFF